MTLKVGDKIVVAIDDPENFIRKGCEGTILEPSHYRDTADDFCCHVKYNKIARYQDEKDGGKFLKLEDTEGKTDQYNFTYYTITKRLKLLHNNWKKALEDAD